MDRIKLWIYVLLIVIGLTLIIFPYKEEKKNKAFEKMALTLLDSNTEVQVEYIEEEIVVEEELKENDGEVGQNENVVEQNKQPQTTKPVIKEKYIGTIKIPKIGLERGFYDKTSKYNIVDKNVTILSKSNYPNEELGNTILAAHSGNSSIAYFKNLHKLSIDDIAYIKYKNVEYKYKLVNVYTQPKVGKLVIYRNNSKTTLTLITCTKNSKTLQSVYIFERI